MQIAPKKRNRILNLIKNNVFNFYFNSKFITAFRLVLVYVFSTLFLLFTILIFLFNQRQCMCVNDHFNCFNCRLKIFCICFTCFLMKFFYFLSFFLNFSHSWRHIQNKYNLLIYYYYFHTFYCWCYFIVFSVKLQFSGKRCKLNTIYCLVCFF